MTRIRDLLRNFIIDLFFPPVQARKSGETWEVTDSDGRRIEQCDDAPSTKRRVYTLSRD